MAAIGAGDSQLVLRVVGGEAVAAVGAGDSRLVLELLVERLWLLLGRVTHGWS